MNPIRKTGFALRAALGAAALAATTLVSAQPAAERPQYGGTLSVATVYYTISALTWDLADWNWKQNHDTGAVRELLLSADLSKARSRSGPHAFTMDVFVPRDALRGELAESWEWEGPLTLVMRLRRGVFFPEKPGVMKRRELSLRSSTSADMTRSAIAARSSAAAMSA